MARPKPKPKPGSKGPSRGDLEALALLALGAFLFLAASLWPEPPFSGDLGRALKTALYRQLGWTAALLPLPFGYGVAAALLRRRFWPFLRQTLLALLLALFTLPLLVPLAPGWAGRLGRAAFALLTGRLGAFGLLLPGLLALLSLDLLAQKPPFYGLRRALWGLVGWAARRREGARIRAEARALQKEVEALAARFPDHAVLGELAGELAAFLRGRGGADLEAWRERLALFREDRAAELKAALAQEAPPLAEAIEAERKALKPLSPGRDPLLSALEERRRALALELKALLAEARSLERAARAAERRLPQGLDAEARAHRQRLARWRNLEERYHELKTRVENWWAWVDWAEAAPDEAREPGLKLLTSEGLKGPPPRLQEAAPPKKDGKKAPPAPKPPERAPEVPPPEGLALPPPDLLDPPDPPREDPEALLREAQARAEVINQTLAQFGLKAKVVDWARGPSVTRYEIEPAPGEKIARIQSLANDLARALAVGVVRIEAPIPGKSVIGLEVPNAEREVVRFSEALADKSYARFRGTLPLILGKSIEGRFWVRDLAKMPHLLIAGSTGSGKSVAINALVMSLLFKYLPTELRLLMIDPKMVELTPYDGIPHLVRGVVTNPADAAGVLLGAVAHMERRYKMMSKVGVRSLEQYNKKMREAGEPPLPYLVIVIDELADLMITSPKEVEQAILRLAQMARATGMHLILATQRPSVDILTSLIKVNIPARIAFAVSSVHDSRTILDTTGAERLTGQGDMLFSQPGLAKPVRLQGPYLSDAEIHRITGYLRVQPFDDAFGEKYGADFDGPGLFTPSGAPTAGAQAAAMDFSDPLLEAAARIVVEEGQGSVSRLQRRLSIGHARAGKLMDLLEAMGIVGPHQGSKPREVLITEDQLEEFFGKPH